MLNWADQFNICCFLDNHQYNFSPHTFECLLAAGAEHYVQAQPGTAFDQLKAFADQHPDWIFGHFGYDLKNEIENLVSELPDDINFPDLFFFVPKYLIKLDQSGVEISSQNECAGEIFEAINKLSSYRPPADLHQKAGIDVQQKFSREQYIKTVKALQQHILRGDCYELNFCQEFFLKDVEVDAMTIYQNLVSVSPNPFAAYYKINNCYLLCASPERYLKKNGNMLVSQPIKGTAGRNVSGNEDMESRLMLETSAKDRSENVMIVDLVRNDLSKVCLEGSVTVNELFGIYSFPQVHQMISTISGVFDPTLHWIEAIRQTFPMGSMTGAPKKRVMELIETYELSRRGIFSGAVGYITPDRNFDFNVVIRSIMYNSNKKYLSFQAGSGITFYSEAEKEYEECLLKVAAIKKVLIRSDDQHSQKNKQLLSGYDTL